MEALTVYTARAVRTLNPSLPVATAVAVRGDRIVEVGTLETLQPWLDAHPHRIDDTFRDRVLMPGFIDPHLHPTLAAVLLPCHFITAMEWKLPGRVAAPVKGHNAYLDRLKTIDTEMADPRRAAGHLGLSQDLARHGRPAGAQRHLADPADLRVAALVPRNHRQRRRHRLDGPRPGRAGAPRTDRSGHRAVLRDRPLGRAQRHEGLSLRPGALSRRAGAGRPRGPCRRPHHDRRHGGAARRPGDGMAGAGEGARPARHPLPLPDDPAGDRTRRGAGGRGGGGRAGPGDGGARHAPAAVRQRRQAVHRRRLLRRADAVAGTRLHRRPSRRMADAAGAGRGAGPRLLERRASASTSTAPATWAWSWRSTCWRNSSSSGRA